MGAFGMLVSYPGSSGRIGDLSGIIAAAHNVNALVAVATDLLGDVRADPGRESWGPTQWWGRRSVSGCPWASAAPHAGFIAVRESAMRSLPGRLAGVSIDDAGAVAYRLTLQTREQHIRRERGYQQHLYRPGAAGGDGCHVRPSTTAPRGWPASPDGSTA